MALPARWPSLSILGIYNHTKCIGWADQCKDLVRRQHPGHSNQPCHPPTSSLQASLERGASLLARALLTPFARLRRTLPDRLLSGHSGPPDPAHQSQPQGRRGPDLQFRRPALLLPARLGARGARALPDLSLHLERRGIGRRELERARGRRQQGLRQLQALHDVRDPVGAASPARNHPGHTGVRVCAPTGSEHLAAPRSRGWPAQL